MRRRADACFTRSLVRQSRRALLLESWQRHRRLAAVGTIALRQCDRPAGGAVRVRRTAEFGRKHERRTTRRGRDPDVCSCGHPAPVAVGGLLVEGERDDYIGFPT